MIPWWSPGVTQQIIDFTLDTYQKKKASILGIRPGYFDEYRRWSDIIELLPLGPRRPNIGDLGPQVKPRDPQKPPGSPYPALPPGIPVVPDIDLNSQPQLDHRPPGQGVQVAAYQGPLWEAQARTNPLRSIYLKPLKFRKKSKFKRKMLKRYVFRTAWSNEMDVDPVNRQRKPAGAPPNQRHPKRHKK